MKFVCKKNKLSDAIRSILKAVPKKSTVQALEGIKVKVSPTEVELTAFNLEWGIKTTVSASSDSEFEFVANSKLLNEFVKKMDGEDISIEVDDNNIIKLLSNKTECSFSAISADKYPNLPTINIEKSFQIQESVLKSMINMTIFAVSENENKPIFTGELFDIENGKFTLVAVDGFRLAIRSEDIRTTEKFNFVVPGKALQEIVTLISDNSDKECTISVSDKHIIFEINNFFVISRLLDGAFHNYKLSIPNSCKTEVFVNKNDLVNSLDRCSLIINDKVKSPIRCEIGGGIIKVDCNTTIGRINDAIPADIQGESLIIGFNNKLVLDALRATEGDKIRIRFNGSMKVIEILPLDGEDYMFLIMPIQLRG